MDEGMLKDHPTPLSRSPQPPHLEDPLFQVHLPGHRPQEVVIEPHPDLAPLHQQDSNVPQDQGHVLTCPQAPRQEGRGGLEGTLHPAPGLSQCCCHHKCPERIQVPWQHMEDGGIWGILGGFGVFWWGFGGFSRFYGVSLWLLWSSHGFLRFLRVFWGLLWGCFGFLVVFEVFLWFYGIFL